MPLPVGRNGHLGEGRWGEGLRRACPSSTPRTAGTWPFLPSPLPPLPVSRSETVFFGLSLKGLWKNGFRPSGVALTQSVAPLTGQWPEQCGLQSGSAEEVGAGHQQASRPVCDLVLSSRKFESWRGPFTCSPAQSLPLLFLSSLFRISVEVEVRGDLRRCSWETVWAQSFRGQHAPRWACCVGMAVSPAAQRRVCAARNSGRQAGRQPRGQ